jgi:hypothetical protein
MYTSMLESNILLKGQLLPVIVSSFELWRKYKLSILVDPATVRYFMI